MAIRTSVAGRRKTANLLKRRTQTLHILCPRVLVTGATSYLSTPTGLDTTVSKERHDAKALERLARLDETVS